MRGVYLIVGCWRYFVAAKITLTSTTAIHSTPAAIRGAFSMVALNVVGSMVFTFLGGCGGAHGAHPLVYLWGLFCGCFGKITSCNSG